MSKKKEVKTQLQDFEHWIWSWLTFSQSTNNWSSQTLCRVTVSPNVVTPPSVSPSRTKTKTLKVLLQPCCSKTVRFGLMFPSKNLLGLWSSFAPLVYCAAKTSSVDVLGKHGPEVHTHSWPHTAEVCRSNSRPWIRIYPLVEQRHDSNLIEPRCTIHLDGKTQTLL